MNVRNLGMALTGVLVLGGCASQHGDVVVGANYDKLGSCFYRASAPNNEDNLFAGASLRTNRLTDPNELDISRYARSLWGSPMQAWTVKFIERDPMHSRVIEIDRAVVDREHWKLMKRVDECVQRG